LILKRLEAYPNLVDCGASPFLTPVFANPLYPNLYVNGKKELYTPAFNVNEKLLFKFTVGSTAGPIPASKLYPAVNLVAGLPGYSL
jgi:hypothetical protein